MLDAFIIEELKKQREQQRQDHRPALEIPVDDEDSAPDQRPGEDRDERGVVIIDYGA